MRFGHGTYPEEGFNYDQTSEWQARGEALLNEPIDFASEAQQQDPARELKAHVLNLFRDRGSRFCVYGTDDIYPAYGETVDDDTDALDWQKLKDSLFGSNLRLYMDGLESRVY